MINSVLCESGHADDGLREVMEADEEWTVVQQFSRSRRGAQNDVAALAEKLA